jgi:hypothetical protein
MFARESASSKPEISKFVPAGLGSPERPHEVVSEIRNLVIAVAWDQTTGQGRQSSEGALIVKKAGYRGRKDERAEALTIASAERAASGMARPLSKEEVEVAKVHMEMVQSAKRKADAEADEKVVNNHKELIAMYDSLGMTAEAKAARLAYVAHLQKRLLVGGASTSGDNENAENGICL